MQLIIFTFYLYFPCLLLVKIQICTSYGFYLGLFFYLFKLNTVIHTDMNCIFTTSELRIMTHEASVRQALASSLVLCICLLFMIFFFFCFLDCCQHFNFLLLQFVPRTMRLVPQTFPYSFLLLFSLLSVSAFVKSPFVLMTQITVILFSSF